MTKLEQVLLRSIQNSRTGEKKELIYIIDAVNNSFQIIVIDLEAGRICNSSPGESYCRKNELFFILKICFVAIKLPSALPHLVSGPQ